MTLSHAKITRKEITVGIVGLGYVGYPLALQFAESNVKVIGFDVDKEKISKILSGKSYIKHINHGRLQKILSEYSLDATSDFSKISLCDAVIICVPTPLSKHLEPDLSFIVETCKAIAPHLQSGALVSLESTTWPGTTEEVVKPLVGDNVHLAYSPEREDPGNKEYKTKTIPKLVGATTDEGLKLATALYELAIDHVIPVKSAKSAEAAKLFENVFRSVNIALVNELKIIFDKMGINIWEVIEAASTKPFGFMPFFPGPGLGGHCIPIDPFYLTWKAKEFGITTRFIELAGEINRNMPNFVVTKVMECLNHFGKALKGSKILILGLSYKPDIDDYRESPSFELIRLLEEKGAEVSYNDPYFEEIGPTREYSEFCKRRSQHLSDEYDCFLIATNHSIYRAEEILSYGIPVVDTRNCLPENPNVFTA